MTRRRVDPKARRRIVSSRPYSGDTPELTPKEAAFVEATIRGAGSQLEAARIAGYQDPQAYAHKVANRPIVAAAIAERRTAAQIEANFDVAMLYRELMIVAADREPENYSPKVRAIEVGLRAAGELGPDVRVSVDARSVILPSVDPTAAASAYAALFGAGVSRETPATDAGTLPAGGG